MESKRSQYKTLYAKWEISKFISISGNASQKDDSKVSKYKSRHIHSPLSSSFCHDLPNTWATNIRRRLNKRLENQHAHAPAPSLSLSLSSLSLSLSLSRARARARAHTTVPSHCENKPIQIKWKFYHQKMKILPPKNENFPIKIRIFFIFLLKTYCGYSL